MPRSDEGPPPSAEEVAALRAELETLMPRLIARAGNLLRRFRNSSTPPEEIVNEAAMKILHAYSKRKIRESVAQVAYTAVARVVIDAARQTKRIDLLDDTGVVADPGSRLADPIVRRRLERFEPREQCVLRRRVLERHTVQEAFRLCKWESKSPFAEWHKILGKVSALLEERS